MKNLLLPEHFEIGDLVLVIDPPKESSGYLIDYWSRGKGEFWLISDVSWDIETLLVTSVLRTTVRSAPFKFFKIVKKNTNKLVKLIT